MANFDFLKKKAAKAVNKVSQVAETAVEKGSEMAEIGKLKMKISGKERQIEDLYYKIGKAVYESGSYPASAIADCEAINVCRKEIEELRGKIEWIKGGTVEDESDEGFAVPEEEVVVSSMEPIAEEQEDASGETGGDDFSGIEIPVDNGNASETAPEEKESAKEETDNTEKQKKE